MRVFLKNETVADEFCRNFYIDKHWPFEAGLLRGWIIGNFGQSIGDCDEDARDVGGNEIGDYAESASSVVSCNVCIYGRDDISSERTRLCQEFVVRALARDRTGFADNV